MARNDCRQHSGGGWQNRNHPYNPNYARNQASNVDYKDTIRCNYCDVQRPRLRFPKAVLEKYDRKHSRGEDPASVRAICRDCCHNPQSSSALPRTQPAASSSSSSSVVPARGVCTSCHIDFPLTDKFFTKWDRKLDAPNRTCFSCKNKRILDEAVDSSLVPDGYEIDLDDPEEHENIVPDLDEFRVPEEELQTKFEDLDQDEKRRAERAGQEHSRLATKICNALQLAQRRRRFRFRPVIDQLRDQELQDSLQRLTLENRLGELDFERLQISTVTRRNRDEIEVEPEFPTLLRFWRTIARTAIADLVEPPAHPSDHHVVSESSEDEDDEEDCQAQEHLEYLRLPDYERDAFLRNRRLANALKSENRCFVDVYTSNAQQVADSEENRLSDLIEQSLAISERALLSHRQMAPSFDVAIFGERYLPRNASAASTSAFSTASTSALTPASGSTPTANDYHAFASSSISTAHSDGSVASAATSQSTKHPRVVQRETPVDPRRALFAHRYPQAQSNMDPEATPPAVNQQQQSQQAGGSATIKLERF